MTRSSAQRPRWRRLRIVFLVAVALIVNGLILTLAYRAYYVHAAEQRLQAAIAVVEAEDPVWRLEDLLAQRKVIPDDQNSAPHIMAAVQLLPRNWPNRPAVSPPQTENDRAPPGLANPWQSDGPLLQRLENLEPTEPWDDNLARDLQVELAALAPAVDRAKPVIDLPKGRHPVQWKRDLISTRLPGVDASRQVAQLFRLSALRQAYAGKMDEALAYHRGMLNAGRSIGDEPMIVCQMMRYNLDRMACQTLKRILAQGAPTEAALFKVQQALGDEVKDLEPLVLYALKAERGAFFNVLDLLAAGEMSLDEFDRGRAISQSWLQSARSWLWIQPRMRMGQAAYLEKMTRAIAIARLPVAEQPLEFAQFEEEVEQYKRASPTHSLAVMLIPAVGKVLAKYHRLTAELACARTAVAAERYRLAHGRWPQSLEELVPEFLEEVPRDVFGTGPLRCRQLKDGLLIYSAGPDGEDEPDEPEAPVGEPEIGFRLWDVAHRGRR